MAKMRILRLMCGKTKKNKIWNQRKCGDLRVILIDAWGKIDLNGWTCILSTKFGAAQMCDQIKVEDGKRIWGRPKMRCFNIITKGTGFLGLTPNMAIAKIK